MNNSKLFDLLQCLTPAEHGDLSVFLSFQVNAGHLSESGLALYYLLQKHTFHLPNSWNKERVWKQLFPKSAYSDAALRKIMHQLNHATLEFLGYQQFVQQRQLFRQITLQQLWKRGLSKHAKTIKKQTEKYLTVESYRNAAFHYHQFEYHRQNYLEEERSSRKEQLTTWLKRMDYHLECYYLTNKLRHYCDSISNRVFFALAGEEMHLPHGFLEDVFISPYFQETSVRVYALIARMLEEPDNQDWFQQVKHLLRDVSDQFEPDEQDALYIFLKNYCIGYQINQGNSSYFQELFDLSKTLLEKGVTQRNGDITPQAYKNIITVGLYVKAFDWTEQFIRDFTELLPESERQNALNYNLAKVFFAQRKYQQVIEQLREVAYDNHTYALGSKLMLIKTYYELEEDRALESLIDSFRIYLRRNRTISRDVRQQYSSILKFVKKLLYLPPNSQQARVALRQEIEASEPVADKDWILEKIS